MYTYLCYISYNDKNIGTDIEKALKFNNKILYLAKNSKKNPVIDFLNTLVESLHFFYVCI